MKPEYNQDLAELSLAIIGLGIVPDKIINNHLKSLSVMRGLAKAKTFGVMINDPWTGITEVAWPKGVIGLAVSSIDPGVTPKTIL